MPPWPWPKEPEIFQARNLLKTRCKRLKPAPRHLPPPEVLEREWEAFKGRALEDKAESKKLAA